MKGFKGFDKDMKCRDKQYAVGEDYTEEEAVLCQKGMHFCEYPLDCFGYYSPNNSRFCEVEAPDEAVSEETEGDTKRATTKIKIGAELSFRAITEAAVKYTFKRSNQEGERATGDQGAASATGDRGAASATGYQGAASATGDRGAASATGSYGAASATGRYGAASATGYQGASSATGDYGAASATGDQGAASATGDRGAASATGDRGAASATGYQGAASAENSTAVAVACGYKGRAKGVIGSALFLAERNDNGEIIHVAAVIVDGKTVEEGVYYTLCDGEIAKI